MVKQVIHIGSHQNRSQKSIFFSLSNGKIKTKSPHLFPWAVTQQYETVLPRVQVV
jgi:hypothetical protein